MLVKLETSDGHFVGFTVILPFQTPPDVVGWGDRVFQHHAQITVGKYSCQVYRECFAFAIATKVAGELPANLLELAQTDLTNRG